MEIWNDIKNIKLESTAITIGNFDGVHMGHQKLINALGDVASSQGLYKVIFTFKGHTSSILHPGKSLCLLTDFDDKIQFLKKYNPDFIITLDFDCSLSQMSYIDFFKEVLVDRLGCKALVIGEDFRMGYGGMGDAKKIADLCNAHGVSLKVVSPAKVYGNIVSSTYIRNLISEGQVDVVKDYLGRYYEIKGVVVRGKQLGRTIGFPTVNLSYCKNRCLPKKGVYVTYSFVRGKGYLSITNVGVKPTVKDDREMTVESHLIGYSGDLYGEAVKIVFLKRIRDEKKFESIGDLKRQLQEDMRHALNYDNLFYNRRVLC